MNPASDSREILVIGYGNTLRGDDGVGPMLATAVAEHGWPEVRSIAAPQLTPELAESLAGARSVIFIDARLGLTPEVEVASLIPFQPNPVTAHACDPLSLLAIARDLFGHAPPAWMVTVIGTDFGLGETLSAACQVRAQEAMKRINGLILSFKQSCMHQD